MVSSCGLLPHQETCGLGFIWQLRIHTISQKMTLDHLAWLSTVFQVKCHPETFRSESYCLPKVVLWRGGVVNREEEDPPLPLVVIVDLNHLDC